MTNYTIFDIETDGLLQKVTKIHCLSYEIHDGGTVIKGTLTDTALIKEFILAQTVLVGHNIVRYDVPVLEKLLDIKITANLIDTLGLSWYLESYREKHGLEEYGEEFSVPKVKIQDWQNLNLEDYIKRCERDVEINSILFDRQKTYLEAIYDGFNHRIVNYITFKLECLRRQEKQGIDLNVELCERTKEELERYITNKVTLLSEIMPKELGKVLRTKPKIRMDSWYKYLRENNLSEDLTEVREAPNPNSHAQLKEWLFSLGWQPITFKVSKSTGQKVPQLSLPFGQGLCSSVKDLYEVEPKLVELEGLYVARHRLSIIDGFLETKDENNKVYSTAHGFTNTLRLEHSKPIVNLPGVDKAYGDKIRGCLKIPSSDYVMCGADISGLEDNTKQHYIYFFDPEYVKQMRVPGFDPHIDIALVGKMITEEEAELFKKIDNSHDPSEFTAEQLAKYKRIKSIRKDAKVVNFSATYGAGPPKIAESLKKPLKEAQALYKVYWERNKAVKKVANSVKVKTVGKHKWLYNPLSKFWMYVKAEKDKFSTLNQSKLFALNKFA